MKITEMGRALLDQEYSEILKQNGLTDEAVAKAFGYANHHSFITSSARERIRKGVMEILRKSS